MANQEVVTNFNNLYDQMYAKFRPSYTPQSASTLKDTLSRAMRPSYDKQIANRRKDAASIRAGIDADATSRGMGGSTYVTDVKNRNMNAEAADVQGIESDYNAALYSALLNRLNAQDELSLTAENQARGNALGAANALFGLYNTTSGGGGRGGWGGRGKSPAEEELPGDDGFNPLASNPLKEQAASMNNSSIFNDKKNTSALALRNRIENANKNYKTKKTTAGSSTRVAQYK
jgi:hypothetical protein